MSPKLYRLRDPFGGRLAVSGRPRSAPALWTDAAGWREQGISMVVSLLEAAEAAQIGLAAQREALETEGIRFLHLPVPDFDVPGDNESVLAAVDEALEALAGGGSVAAHCFAGVGRSPLFVGAVLVRHGLATKEAFARISEARGANVPATREQWQWLTGFEKALNGAAQTAYEEAAMWAVKATTT